ncbi:MAG: hypothetical protein FJ319_14235 [SAR202 cluster bacterium]|nr:hypothetical protein [SAR202 cluster bacterium]
MSEEIIGMRDMMTVFAVTDKYGVDREMVTVPLEKSGEGQVRRLQDRVVEIVVPAGMAEEAWAAKLAAALESMGFEAQEVKW